MTPRPLAAQWVLIRAQILARATTGRAFFALCLSSFRGHPSGGACAAVAAVVRTSGYRSPAVRQAAVGAGSLRAEKSLETKCVHHQPLIDRLTRVEVSLAVLSSGFRFDSHSGSYGTHVPSNSQTQEVATPSTSLRF